MIARLRTVLLAFLVLGSISTAMTIASAGCRSAAPVSVTTPAGRAAYQLEDVVDAVNLLQHEAIKANKAGLLKDDATRAVILYRRTAAHALDAAIDAGGGRPGVLAGVKSGLDALDVQLGPTAPQPVITAIGAVRIALVALGVVQ